LEFRAETGSGAAAGSDIKAALQALPEDFRLAFDLADC